jgi:DNA polymerase-3 subunit delta'
VTGIVGHKTPMADLVGSLSSPRLHHAWLFAGDQGIGKATVARAFARTLLCCAADLSLPRDSLAVAASHRVGRLFDAMTHPDFLLVERLPKDPKLAMEVAREDWPADTERARSITIEQIRALNPVLSMKPSLSARRVIMIDAIDDLERGAANALLKSLEEPPHGTLFILISHAPGRLLPTIRSRCRVLRFHPLSDEEMRNFLAARQDVAGPDEVEVLVRAGGGSPGRALGFAGLDLAAIDAALERIAHTGDPANTDRIALALSLSSRQGQARYEAFLTRVPEFVAGKARSGPVEAMGRVTDVWARTRELASSAQHLSLDPQMTVIGLAGLVASLAVNSERVKA